jgi:hypothetical protein
MGEESKRRCSARALLFDEADLRIDEAVAIAHVVSRSQLSEHACASRPGGNIALEEGRELFSAWW